MERIIECKGIDSSLFLQPDEDDKDNKRKSPLVVDRTNDVLTSQSIVMLNQNIKLERKMLKVHRYEDDSYNYEYGYGYDYTEKQN